MRVDAHQHFWRYRCEEYPWMSPDMEVLRRDWLPQDLLPLLDAHEIDTTIAVQARGSEAETGFLLELAGSSERIAGVVGWVDLRCEDLPERLARLQDSEKLVGFRHQVQDEPDAGAFLTDPHLQRGVAALQEASLVYEVLVFADQLAHVPAFCAACDGHWLVLDHLGKPAIRAGNIASWRRAMAPLGAMPHVSCKLSGLVTEAADAQGRFEAGEIRPYLDAALEIFGPERLMFGSDWPVCLLAATYAEVVALVEDWSATLSRDEVAALHGETACRTYALAAAASRG